MRMMTLRAVACLAVAFSLPTSASAQTERTRPADAAGGPVQGGTIAPPTKTTKPIDPARPFRGPGASTVKPLTEAECGSLGGKVKEGIAACLSGKACQTTGEDQKVRAVCISRTIARPTKTTKPIDPARPFRGPGATTVKPLTQAECVGLGGKVGTDAKCATTGKTCIRADQNGVLHSACLTLK